MIEIAGVQFPLTFAPHIARREVVLLGVIPVGSIDKNGYGRWYWSLDLPVVRKARPAASQDEARAQVRQTIVEWLEAAMASPAEQSRARA